MTRAIRYTNNLINDRTFPFAVFSCAGKMLLLFFFLIITFPVAYAQKDSDKTSAKTKTHKHEVELADKYFDNYEYFLAAQEYEKALNANPDNKYALFRLAESYRLFFNYDKAEEFYKKAAQFAGKEYPLSGFWYALMMKTNGKYVDAKKEFAKYLDAAAGKVSDSPENKAFYDKATLEMEGCELALTEMKKPQRNYLFENLPGPVNTADSEYSPTIF
jgi:Tfp pilus assembly protein PilF